ncbi:AMIN-like domain-containing (lipo)protein [Yinghuangia sp. YIM S09857]|uniref:AMIN-like domain-containing (lipo)protein n=1 Tax=Yinghuangia sp. YIM S09857 TaxID=3436929 RepID=UPI003F533CBA
MHLSPTDSEPSQPRRRTRVSRTTRSAVATAAAGAFIALALLPVTAAQAAAPAAVTRTVAAAPTAECAEPAAAPTYLTNIRTGRHAGFDRIVLDFSGNVPAYGSIGGPDQLQYCGSGQTVPLTGAEYTEITTNAAAHDENGDPTYPGPRLVYTPHLAKVTGFAVTCDFEGHLNVGFATKAGVTEIHTFPLTNPGRIVIDVRY